MIVENQPARLYLDAEYDIELNSTLDGDVLLKKYLTVFNAYLSTMLGVTVLLSDCLILDSSSAKKFSKHVIYNIKRNNYEYVFKNNLIIKDYVHDFETKLAIYINFKGNSKLYLNNKDQNNFQFLERFSINYCSELLGVVDKRDKVKSSFIDKLVYSKNRNFRTMLSTKYNEERNLKLCPHSSHTSFKSDSNIEFIFRRTLITLVNENKIIIEPLTNQRMKKHASNVVENIPAFVSLTENSELSVNDQCHIDMKKTVTVTRKKNKVFLDADARKILKDLIFEYLKDYSKEKEWSGLIREVRCENGEVLFCDIYNTYCFNVMRAHKRNNVYYVVNLKSFEIFQKCYKCKDFSSEKRKICNKYEGVKVFVDQKSKNTYLYTINDDDFASSF